MAFLRFPRTARIVFVPAFPSPDVVLRSLAFGSRWTFLYSYSVPPLFIPFAVLTLHCTPLPLAFGTVLVDFVPHTACVFVIFHPYMVLLPRFHCLCLLLPLFRLLLLVGSFGWFLRLLFYSICYTTMRLLPPDDISPSPSLVRCYTGWFVITGVWFPFHWFWLVILPPYLCYLFVVISQYSLPQPVSTPTYLIVDSLPSLLVRARTTYVCVLPFYSSRFVYILLVPTTFYPSSCYYLPLRWFVTYLLYIILYAPYRQDFYSMQKTEGRKQTMDIVYSSTHLQFISSIPGSCYTTLHLFRIILFIGWFGWRFGFLYSLIFAFLHSSSFTTRTHTYLPLTWFDYYCSLVPYLRFGSIWFVTFIYATFLPVIVLSPFPSFLAALPFIFYPLVLVTTFVHLLFVGILPSILPLFCTLFFSCYSTVLHTHTVGLLLPFTCYYQFWSSWYR